MTNTTEKIFVGIDDEVIELKGEAKAAFILDRQNEAKALEDRKAKIQAKEATKKAILDRIGLTADELKTILG
jgi:hypothetical protein